MGGAGIDAKDDENETMLHKVLHELARQPRSGPAQRQAADVVEHLVDQGANRSLRDRDGRTASDLVLSTELGTIQQQVVKAVISGPKAGHGMSEETFLSLLNEAHANWRSPNHFKREVLSEVLRSDPKGLKLRRAGRDLEVPWLSVAVAASAQEPRTHALEKAAWAMRTLGGGEGDTGWRQNVLEAADESGRTLLILAVSQSWDRGIRPPTPQERLVVVEFCRHERYGYSASLQCGPHNAVVEAASSPKNAAVLTEILRGLKHDERIPARAVVAAAKLTDPWDGGDSSLRALTHNAPCAVSRSLPPQRRLGRGLPPPRLGSVL